MLCFSKILGKRLFIKNIEEITKIVKNILKLKASYNQYLHSNVFFVLEQAHPNWIFVSSNTKI